MRSRFIGIREIKILKFTEDCNLSTSKNLFTETIADKICATK